MMIVHHLVLANAEEVKSPVIPQIAEILVGLVAFSLLFLLLRSKAVPKFEQAFRERTDAIQGGIERAEAAQQEAASALASYKAQLADAKGEAQKMREEARVEGAAIIEEMRTKAQDEASRITAAARSSIEAERAQAMNSLMNEVGAIATALASKIVGESLDDQVRQSRVVDRFLVDLEGSK
jgi:F-type H+-transporting ATPase subunit b